MDIQKEIRITEKSTPVFFAGTEMSELYEALVRRWGMEGIGPFNASIFYSLGVAHGKHQERMRRK